jgi:hypothetical protein
LTDGFLKLHRVSQRLFPAYASNLSDLIPRQDDSRMNRHDYKKKNPVYLQSRLDFYRKKAPYINLGYHGKGI